MKQETPLLFWQRCLLALVLGLWSYKFFVPGLSTFCLAFIFLAPRKLFNSFLLILFFLSGLGIGSIFTPHLSPSKVPRPVSHAHKVDFHGKIEKIRTAPDHKLKLFIENVQIEDKGRTWTLPGYLLLTWENPPAIPWPEQHIKGKLRIKPVHGTVNEGGWDSEFYWHRQKVFFRAYARGRQLTMDPYPRNFLVHLRLNLRQKVIQVLDKYFVDEPRIKGLGLALLMNDRYFLNSEFVDKIRLSSLGHTLALSGLHLGLVVFLGWVLSYAAGFVCPNIYLYIPRPKLSIILSIPLVIIYLWLGQAPVSLVRASIMFFCWAFLYLKNRSRFIIDGLFYALLVILLVDPLSIFDLSLQLSFLAVLGLGLTYPYLKTIFERPSLSTGRMKIVKYFLMLTAVTLIANLTLLPAQTWAFGYLTPHIYLNLLWLPVLGFLVLPLGFVGVLFLFFPLLENLGPYLFYLMGLVLKGLIVVLDFLDAHDLLHPIVTFRPGWEHMLTYWFVFLAFIYWTKLWQRRMNLYLGLALIFTINFSPVTFNNFNGVKLRLLDVGQGQSILCELPGGKRVLIDGGGSWSLRFDLGKYITSPAITWKAWPQIDKVFLTHSDADHLRGLYYPLSNLKVGEFIFNGVWPGGQDKELLTRALDLGGEKVRVTARGDVWDLGRDIKLHILHPTEGFVDSKNNNRSLVLLLTWKNRRLALIPGDIERKGIKHLLRYNDALRSEVLIWPHHGSRASFSAEFYRRVNPEIVLVSAGFLNRFHLPHKKVVNYLKRMGCRVLNTATHGEIQISWSGWNKPAQVSWLRLAK
ncbi:DNA internalization-related competence protein ComEC/Rec2 [Desulfohalobiaceae bacterium Ax17]|uniref:DNA internalization-related competence protein ComEC/Rec2 n=1 Tax=Desulfovulcanus ferrireducens TaxID=2831190 RepID=UPI00207BB7D3|nr:DNA internalization-related competence protein ComEC/Rec2 [Desulfovulcanus ferrireducens]